MNTKATVNEGALAALDAGIAAADALPAGAEPEMLNVPAPEPEPKVEPVPEPKPDDAPVPDPAPKDEPKGDEPPKDEPPADATPEARAAKAEADAAAADAEEARGLGFKNQKGVEAYQNVKKEAREATRKFDELNLRVTEELQPRAEAFTNFRNHMESIGCKPEQFGLAVSMIDAFNSGDPKKLTAVAEELEGQLRQVREKLGIATPAGQELYELDAELKAEVEAGDLTVARANELARVRKLSAANTAHETAAAARAREESERQAAEETAKSAAIEQAAADLDALGQRLHALEPDVFKHKIPAVLEKFMAIRDQTPPAKWESKLREIYDNEAGPPAQKKAPVGHVPLRGAGTPGGASPVSTTPLDALNAGLAAANAGKTW